jgi:hypothetical protein
VHAVGLSGHDEVKTRWAALSTQSHGLEKTGGRGRLVRDDKDVGRL